MERRKIISITIEDVDVVGGDTVPYCSTTATLAEEIICNCPDMDEEIDIPYEETNGGKNVIIIFMIAHNHSYLLDYIIK